jgi:hypothetical protein
LLVASNEVGSGTEQSLSRLKMLVWLAVAGAVLAAIAGLVLLAAEPDAGSTAEGALGIAAAVGGLSAAGFSIAAAIYAQVKGLWGLAPKPIRYVLWVIIAIGVGMTLWSWGTNFFT